MKTVWHWTASVYLQRPRDGCACTHRCCSSAGNSCSCLWQKLVLVERTRKNKFISPDWNRKQYICCGIFFQQWFTFVACTYPPNPAGGTVHLQVLQKIQNSFFFIAVPVTILQLYNIKIHRPYQFKARSEFRDCLADREFPTTGCYNTWNIFTQMNVIEAAAINWISVWSLTALSYKVCRLTG